MKKKIDFKSMSLEELLKQEKEMRLELLKCSYNIRNHYDKNIHKKVELKKNIARILTELTIKKKASSK